MTSGLALNLDASRLREARARLGGSSRRTPTTTSFEPRFPPPWARAPLSTLEWQGGREEGPGPVFTWRFPLAPDHHEGLATHSVGEDADVLDLSFDSGLKRLYVSAESVNVTIFPEQGKRLGSEGSLFTAHAHSVCVDPDAHLVSFLPQDIDGHPVLRVMEPTLTDLAHRAPSFS